MARQPVSAASARHDVPEKIIDIDVASEMEGSFLEYAYSVIYSRALPDARDGLKPVQRRILFQMTDMGLRPDRPYVKSARVVGDVMGKLHPHGDTAIYDALVRLAQDFSLRIPLVDGHGNFGSLDDGPAAPRYTEARPSAAATAMTKDLGENVVNFGPNYDNKLTQPEVLPAALPNLLVNGASGIAVGMATNMPPHNLNEVIAAAQHLLAHPDADLEDLMRLIPGPDLPTGGTIVGLDGIRDAYRGGRGTFRTRAMARIENISPRRQGIVITELPYLVGPEKVIEKIADGVKNKKIQGVAAATDLTDREHGLRLVVEVKTGFNPEAVLEQLYRFTPLEDSFGINNVALVGGQPRTLGLRELLDVWVNHRIDVVRRRCEYRLAQRLDRQHLVDGLLVAIVDIDRVIAVIRNSDDTASARSRLIDSFNLSSAQADYILELQLRRLTKFSRIELENERDRLREDITQLRHILANTSALHRVVSEEMSEVAKTFGTPRRTVLQESAGQSVTSATAAVPLEVADSPCQVVLSTTGLIARSADDAPIPRSGRRGEHDAVRATVATTARADIAVLTSQGRAIRVPVVELPVITMTASPSLSAGIPVTELVSLAPGEQIVTAFSMEADAPPMALGTAGGVVKRFFPSDVPSQRDDWEVISLKESDRVVGAAPCPDADELVLITSDANLLHFAASAVRPQGRSAAGMAGVRLNPGQHVVFCGVVPAGVRDLAVVVTVAGSATALPGTHTGAAKVTPYELYPGKGRATGGVRAHRFLKGEDTLLAAWVGQGPPRALNAQGQPVELPDVDQRRDGSGSPLPAGVDTIG